MTNFSTASTFRHAPITAEAILDAAKRLKDLPNNDKFIVVDPDGQIYIGTAQEVLPVVTRHHPLLKMPLAFGFKNDSLG